MKAPLYTYKKVEVIVCEKDNTDKLSRRIHDALKTAGIDIASILIVPLPTNTSYVTFKEDN